MRNTTLVGAAVIGILATSLTAGAAGKFKCDGGNACKGQGGCKNPKMAKKNASAECKGHSFVLTKDEAACTALKAKKRRSSGSSSRSSKRLILVPQGSFTEGSFPDLGQGLGLRPQHYSHVLEFLPPIDWFEVISENFMGLAHESLPTGQSPARGGRPVENLEKIRNHYPIACHGVSLSIGSVDPLDMNYLSNLKALIERFDPSIVSDHLCWTGVHGENLHDLLPLPYTEEAIQHIVSRITQVQEYLGRRILIENVSSYMSFNQSEMPEWDFLNEICRRADCGVLLDINNIYVSAKKSWL